MSIVTVICCSIFGSRCIFKVVLAFTTAKSLHMILQGREDIEIMSIMTDRIKTANIECVALIGLRNQHLYQPRFADPMLQRLADQWRVRVLTPHDIELLAEHFFVGPVELPKTCTSDEKFVMSMLRLTEHSSRCNFLAHCFEHEVLDDREACFQKLAEDMKRNTACTPVPGCLSSAAFWNLVPMLRLKLSDHEGLHVGRFLVFVFKYDPSNVQATPNLAGHTADHVAKLSTILRSKRVPDEVIQKWCAEVGQRIGHLSEEHHYLSLDATQAINEGEGFFIDFLDVDFRDYSILATQAALKRMGQPNGGPELFSTMACVVAQKLSALENKDKVHDLDNLKNIHQIASYFFIEAEAYRTTVDRTTVGNNHRCRSNEIVLLKGIVSNAFRRLVLTLGLVYKSLRLRLCWRPMLRKLQEKFTASLRL